MTLLKIQNITKTFVLEKGMWQEPSLVRAVDGANLVVRKGEHLGVVGESGCGKTTLARVLMKFYQPDTGTVHFEGMNIDSLSTREYRKCVQMVFQDPYSSLDPRYSIRNILLEAFVLENSLSRSQKEAMISKALDDVRLTDAVLDRYPHEFSGGERQRIAIARALLSEPKLLVLDEAVSSLDVLVQQDILHLLDHLQQRLGITYLFISHNLRVVRQLCPKVAVMYGGKIVEYANTEQLFSHSSNTYTQKLLAAAVDYKVID